MKCKNCGQELINLADELWGHGDDDINNDNRNPENCTNPEPEQKQTGDGIKW